MIIDNFGTMKPNPYRWYTPRVVAGISEVIVDGVDWSTQMLPLMAVPDTHIVYQPPPWPEKHVTTDPACVRHRPPMTRWQRIRFDRARGKACTTCRPTKGTNE